MQKTVACVPNFSEGSDEKIIRRIADEIRATKGVQLLDVDPGKDTNRTVITFAGEPEAARTAAFRAIRTAAELIDMSSHHGTHPRVGATDVCPFIPVAEVSVEECISLAKVLARQVGRELRIPVYLYGYAAARPEREKLPDIRKGEYEALPEKLKSPDFKPDFGPQEFNARSGATVIGVRDFMLAYNINLNTKDVAPAREIARNIRETGRPARAENGHIIRRKDGTPVRVPGKLKYCQAIGWYVVKYDRAQVSTNLHNYKVTGLHTAFETVRQEAATRGVEVTGSELIGLAPKQAILDAGKFYLTQRGRDINVAEQTIIDTAVRSLGLNDVVPFNPAEKIIEYRISHQVEQ